MHPSYWLKSGCVAWLHRCITMLCFQLLLTLCRAVQAKNSVINAPANTALTQVLHRSHNTHATNCHLCSKGEITGAQMRTKVSFGRAMMQALELLRMAKRHISGWTVLNSEETKPLDKAIIKFCLSEGISSKSISQYKRNFWNLMSTSWKVGAWLCLTNPA